MTGGLKINHSKILFYLFSVIKKLLYVRFSYERTGSVVETFYCGPDACFYMLVKNMSICFLCCQYFVCHTKQNLIIFFSLYIEPSSVVVIEKSAYIQFSQIIN